jgi:hypothetical protein
MTITTKTFQNLQPGVPRADDLKVRRPVNEALNWLGNGLVDELNTHFAAISQSVSVQISTHLSNRPTFSVHKNNVDQTSISATATPITWSTELWDVGGYFASNAWTPPAGKYRLNVVLAFSNLNAVDAEALDIQLFRDGSVFKDASINRSGTAAETVSLSVLVNASGAHVFDIRARKLGAGIGTVVGSTAQSWFEGEAIS